MNGRIKIAIAGAGFMGETHAQAYQNIANAELAYVVDANTEKCGAFAERYGCIPLNALEDMLETGIDVVDICLPTMLHKDAAVGAFKAGKHVICEKPVALDYDEGLEIDKAAKTYGKKFMVAHVVRFWPEFAELSRMIRQGEFAGIKTMSFSRYGAPPGWSEGGWIINDERSGGIIFDLVIHDIDFVLSVLGVPQWVFARKNKTADFTTYVNALLGYPDVNVLIEGGFIMAKQYPFTTGFRVSNGETTAEYINKSKKGLILYDSSGERKPDYRDCDPYQKELEYFLDCVKNDREVLIGSGSSAADAVKVAGLIRESADRQEKLSLI